jgi:acetolactate synthase small subunit
VTEAKHVITMLVDNQPGVLARVVGLFGGRGFNIESLCVAETINPEISRITLVTRADPLVMEQIQKQLRKLINVIKVRDMDKSKAVQREMALICVRAKPEHRAEVLYHRGHRRRRQTGRNHQFTEAHRHQKNRPDRYCCAVQGAEIRLKAEDQIQMAEDKDGNIGECIPEDS